MPAQTNNNDIQWTPAQSDAININGRTLLVSAAAGSGKTAVLTSRIIRRLTDDSNPSDISGMLVVTFTKSAAGELRERIYKAVLSASEAQPGNRHLKKQLHQLGRAHISTIHSFCLELINANFEAAGLNASSTVMNEYDAEVISRELMEELISDCYDGKVDVGNFTSFIDNFSSLRDDKLGEMILGFYNKLRSYPEGLEYIRESASNRRECKTDNLMNSESGNILRSFLLNFTSHYIKTFNSAIECFFGTKYQSYTPVYSSDYDFLQRLSAASVNRSYEELQALLEEYVSLRLPSVKGAGADIDIQKYRNIRDNFKSELKKLREKYFSAPVDFLVSLEHKSADIFEIFYKFLLEFDRRYKDKKRATSKLDFNDIERCAVRLLWDGNKPSETAERLKLQYNDIYIDEYQDINELQDMIFRAVSRDNNRFMVGDIKQSIYSFRGAAPDIFSIYRDNFPVYDKSRYNIANTIFLSNNFRCDHKIIDFSNLVFRCLFNNNSGRVPYYDADDLIYSKNTDDGDGSPVRIAIIKKLLENNGKSSDNNNSIEEAELKIDNDEAAHTEAKYIASEIRLLLAEGYKKSDITILMRSPKASSFFYEDELRNLDIDCRNEILRSLFESSEILLMLCLLNCIDNPMRDIYLAGALRSPIYGLTIDELACIRSENPSGSLYEALINYTNSHNFQKGRFFIDKLAHYRRYANGCPCDKLIWYLLCDTSMEALVYNECNDETGVTSEDRRANLMLLYEYSRNFESGTFRGLYNFIRYLEDVIASGAQLNKAQNTAGDCVRILSIHQSKGLEFPVCFVCDLSHRFNRDDSRSNIIIERKNGMAMRVREKDGLVLYDTFSRRSAVLANQESQTDEEMRVLYVALTRARERLYITATVKDPESFIDECEKTGEFISPYTMSKCNSMIEWIVTAVKSHEESSCFSIDKIESLPDMRDQFKLPDATCKQQNYYTESEYTKLFLKRFEFRYPYEASGMIPAKLSVSELYPAVLDENDTDSTDIAKFTGEISESLAKPRFISNDQKLATAAERGTATHVFMQFCDFSNVEKQGINNEITRLINKQFIPESYNMLIYKKAIETFFSTQLYSEMRKASQMWREIRFNIKYPASDFTEDKELKSKIIGEELFVQGVIDCIFIDSNERVHLIDYKTDNVPDNEEGRKTLIERHRRQLSYYKKACEELLKRPVDIVAIYSFALGCEIPIEL